MDTSVRFCDNCGATNRSDARFCYVCGQPQLGSPATVTGLLVPSHMLKQRYRIVGKLGQGGFGAIYKVEDQLFRNAIRAVKEMGMHGLSPKETQEAIVAFKNEALLLAELSHPNLPRIYDHFEDHGRWYLVMDYIEGETLETRLEQAAEGKLPVGEVLEIALQVCDVLGYLHSHEPPIIFRDLKPANIMVTRDNHLYLIDFGIARFFKPGQTKDTMILGTPGYAAPEQYGRMQTTIRSDIYSLGATLYHLLSGISPGLNPFLFQPLELDPLVPGNADLEALVMQMLELKEQNRPQNTEIIKQELQRIQQLQQVVLTEQAVPTSQVIATKPVLVAKPVVATPVLEPGLLTTEIQPSVVVAQQGGGDYTTISEALVHVPARALILVREGVYQESLQLDKEVEIIGNGAKERIVLESWDAHTVVMHAGKATLRGLTIRSLVGENNGRYHALAIPQGELFVEDCILTSYSTASIAICNVGTKATIRYCSIQSSPSHGIDIYDQAQTTIEHCEIFQNGEYGACITAGGNPTFRQCTFYENGDSGIFVHEQGQGTCEECEFHHNRGNAVTITSQSNLLMLRCLVHTNERHGLEIRQEGLGSFQDCAIYANQDDNVVVANGSKPYFYLCKVYGSGQAGISFMDHALGNVEYCEIYENELANIQIAGGSDPLIRSSKIYKSKGSGVLASAGARGTIEHCVITENGHKAVEITPESQVVLKGNQLQGAI